MAKKKKTRGKSAGKRAGFGVVLAGAAVAATAGAYYLYGPSGKKHQRQVKGWMLKAKGEVLERAEKLKEIDGKTYHSLVDDVSKKYKKLKHIDSKDVARLSRELKIHWADIEKDLSKRTRKGKRVVKKVIRKVSVQTKKSAVTKKKPSRRKVSTEKARTQVKKKALSRKRPARRK